MCSSGFYKGGRVGDLEGHERDKKCHLKIKSCDQKGA